MNYDPFRFLVFSSVSGDNDRTYLRAIDEVCRQTVCHQGGRDRWDFPYRVSRTLSPGKTFEEGFKLLLFVQLSLLGQPSKEGNV